MNKARRGFASMSHDLQRELAVRGGKASHQAGGHEFTSDEASKAGAKGGAVVSQDRKHMAEIGRKGGSARRRRKQEEST
jgi:general stress protein YciG